MKAVRASSSMAIAREIAFVLREGDHPPSHVPAVAHSRGPRGTRSRDVRRRWRRLLRCRLTVRVAERGWIADGDLAELMLVSVPSADTDLTDPADLLGWQSSRSPCDQSNRRGCFHEPS